MQKLGHFFFIKNQIKNNMCLITNQKKPFIAKEDITCYKSVNIDSGIIKSEFHKFIYELDKLYETKFGIIGDEINDGFHSYPENEYERIKNKLNCVKCIIPKDSEYYIGKYDNQDSYCSNKIIIKEIISDRNRNQLINGKREGYWEYYHDNGKIRSKGNYKDGLEDGLWEFYYNNGRLQAKGNYKNEEQAGLWVWYNDNGNLWYKGNYKEGKADGYWECYYNNGNLRYKGNYKEGERDGYWEEYYSKGNIESKGNYKNGKEVGLWEFYYDNGQLYSKRNYKNKRQE